jgi:hypothetical protein
MSLAPGSRLGPYEIQSALGAGGMSACGHAGVPSAAAALGWRAEPRTCKSEARHQRKFAAGVAGSPTRQPRWGAGWGPAASE